MVRIKEPETAIQKQKSCSKARRTLPYLRGTRTPHIQTETSRTMKNPCRVPRHTSHPFQRKQYPQTQLPQPTTRPYQWRTRV